MIIIVRWTNELRGTVESELSGEWDRSIGAAHFDGTEATVELHDGKATIVLDDQTLYGYVWQENEHGIVVHIPEA